VIRKTGSPSILCKGEPTPGWLHEFGFKFGKERFEKGNESRLSQLDLIANFQLQADSSGLYLIVLFVMSVHITPRFSRSEVQIIRSSFIGLPCFPSGVLLR